MDKKPMKSMKILCYITIAYSVKHNKITYLVSGHAAGTLLLPTRLYTNYLEYVTKGHIATHTILFKFPKMAIFFSFLINKLPASSAILASNDNDHVICNSI